MFFFLFTYSGMGLTDYPTIVKKPMDLGTVKKNLKAEKYTTVDEALDDILLIWQNCKSYNMEGSEIWKLAQQLEKQTNKLIEKTFKVSNKEKNKSNKKDDSEKGIDRTEDETEDKKNM